MTKVFVEQPLALPGSARNTDRSISRSRSKIKAISGAEAGVILVNILCYGLSCWFNIE